MPILVCGSEGEWSLFSNSLSAVGADTKRRGSVFMTFGNQMFKAWTGTNDIWVHARFAGTDQDSNTFAGKPFLRIADAAGQDMVQLNPSNIEFVSFWNLQIQTATSSGGGFATNPETFSAQAQEFVDWDIRIRISTGSNPDDTMTVDVYRNGQFRFSNVTIDATGWGLPSQIRLSEKDLSVSRNHEEMWYQDIVVTDSLPTVGMELAVLVPSAVGVHSDFTNDYTNIDDDGYDPNTVISTTTVGDKESWIFATPTFTLGDKVIYGIVLDTVAQTDIAMTIADFQMFLRINATEYPAASTLGANEINPDSYVTVFQLNPDTTQPWVEADLNALEAGVEST